MNSDMQEIEITIEEAKAKIARRDLVLRLQENPDFKELITEGYFRDEAARVVMLKADENFQEPEKQKKLDDNILGISILGEWLRTQILLGNMAEDSLEAHENTREELRAEVLTHG